MVSKLFPFVELFTRDFQFLWMTDVETVNSITMAFLATPVILVLNTQTHYYYFPDFEVKDITIETMSDFLNRVRDGNIQVKWKTRESRREREIFRYFKEVSDTSVLWHAFLYPGIMGFR